MDPTSTATTTHSRAAAIETSARPDEPYILYAEDNPTDYMFFRRAFRQLNGSYPHRLVYRENGTLIRRYLLDALETGGTLPTLVLLDIKMPGLSGLEVLEFIRDHPKLMHLPVILLSASGEERDLRRAYDNRVNAYLIKPDRYQQLKELVISIANFWIRYNKLATL